MADGDLSEQISDLEAEIDRLASVAESCRKIILISKLAIAIGGVLLLVNVFGLIRLAQRILVCSLALVIVGIVAAGSNAATLRNTETAMRDNEALRSQLIDELNPSVVVGGAEEVKGVWRRGREAFAGTFVLESGIGPGRSVEIRDAR